jgi:hypothetical protein
MSTPEIYWDRALAETTKGSLRVTVPVGIEHDHVSFIRRDLLQSLNRRYSGNGVVQMDEDDPDYANVYVRGARLADYNVEADPVGEIEMSNLPPNAVNAIVQDVTAAVNRAYARVVAAAEAVETLQAEFKEEAAK